MTPKQKNNSYCLSTSTRGYSLCFSLLLGIFTKTFFKEKKNLQNKKVTIQPHVVFLIPFWLYVFFSACFQQPFLLQRRPCWIRAEDGRGLELRIVHIRCVRVTNRKLFLVMLHVSNTRKKYVRSRNMAEEVKESQAVLLIWSGSTPPKKIEEMVVQLNSTVGPAGKVSVEHEERLQLC